MGPSPHPQLHHTLNYSYCNNVNQDTPLQNNTDWARNDWAADQETLNFTIQSTCHPSGGTASHIQVEDGNYGSTGWKASVVDSGTSSENAQYHATHTHLLLNLQPSGWSNFTAYDKRTLICREIGKVVGVARVTSGDWSSHGNANDCMSFGGDPTAQTSKDENSSNYTYTNNIRNHTIDLVEDLYAADAPDVSWSGPALDSAANLQSGSYDLEIEADGGGDTISGIVSIVAKIDGITQPGTATQACTTASLPCDLVRNWEVDTTQLTIGAHELSVIATDAGGMKTTMNTTIDVHRAVASINEIQFDRVQTGLSSAPISVVVTCESEECAFPDLDEASISGPEATDFTMERQDDFEIGENCDAEQTQCTYVVSFAPSEPGESLASLDLPIDESSAIRLPLQGEAFDLPIEPSSSEVDFGTADVSSTADDDLTFSYASSYNEVTDGTLAFADDQASYFTGDVPGDFAVADVDEECYESIDTCNVGLDFKPSAVDQSTATLVSPVIQVATGDLVGYLQVPVTGVGLDSVDPVLDLDSVLVGAAGHDVHGDIRAEVEATDSASGVASASLSVDAAVVDVIESACGPACDLAGVLESTDVLSPGVHSYSVQVADNAGNVTTDSGTFNLTAGIAVEGDLVAASGQWLTSNSYSIDVDAFDGDEGVVEARLRVDGDLVDSVSQSCPSGGCGLNETLDLDATSLTGGVHEIQVQVLYGQSEVMWRSWEVKRNSPGVVSNSEAAHLAEAAIEELSAESAPFSFSGATVDPTLVGASGGWDLEQSYASAFVSSDPSGGISQYGIAGALTVAPVLSGSPADGSYVNDVASFGSVRTNTDLVVRPGFFGPEAYQIIRGSSAPQEQTWEVDLDEDQELEYDDSLFSVSLVDASDPSEEVPVASMSPPIAYDASGTSVPVSVETMGVDSYVIAVDHDSPGVSYPVVVEHQWAAAPEPMDATRAPSTQGVGLLPGTEPVASAARGTAYQCHVRAFKPWARVAERVFTKGVNKCIQAPGSVVIANSINICLQKWRSSSWKNKKCNYFSPKVLKLYVKEGAGAKCNGGTRDDWRGQAIGYALIAKNGGVAVQYADSNTSPSVPLTCIGD